MKLTKKVSDLFIILKDIEKVVTYDIVIGKPVDKKDLDKIEEQLEFQFPNGLKSIYITETSSINFKWIADNDIFGDLCKNGEFNLLSPIKVLQMYEDMKFEVEQAKTNSMIGHDEGLNALVADWLNWVPIIRFSNGDAFSIDKRNLQIVFLEHDVMDNGPNIHGIVIADSFEDLINRWSQIAFADVYDWTEVCDAEGLNICKEHFDLIKSRINI